MMTRLRRMAAGLVLVLPAWAQAQILDFDSVCASPPCPAMSLYAASGIMITPATNVVAAGTGGLVGTNGGKYLYVAAPPYQVSFGFDRVATYYSAAMSRAASSSSAVTVAVTALKNGSPVAGPTNVVLTNVNTWSPVVMNVPGGFDQISVDSSGGANTTFGIDNVQVAGNCFGFSDVQLTDSFCNAAEWLGNRGVTTGCAAGMYCPTNNVTRAQMALFMNRLGTALQPTIFQTQDGGAYTLGSGTVFCKSNVIAGAPFPRTATMSVGLVTVQSDAMAAWIYPLYSTDGGITWNSITDFAGGTFNGALGEYGNVTTAPVTINLAPGVTYQLGIKIERGLDYASTGDITGSACATHVRIEQSNGAGAPFDLTPTTSSPIPRLR
jgi:S-layer homology domain